MKLTDADVLPCGCVIGTHEDAFVIQPCSPGCENFQYVLGETRRQHKPVFTAVGEAEA